MTHERILSSQEDPDIVRVTDQEAGYEINFSFGSENIRKLTVVERHLLDNLLLIFANTVNTTIVNSDELNIEADGLSSALYLMSEKLIESVPLLQMKITRGQIKKKVVSLPRRR
ncbi:MAG: hypothetical protein KF716_24050 [Anaerolineae bacterium]|nr:hypothetical protein [Anaerolineae bacterium]